MEELEGPDKGRWEEVERCLPRLRRYCLFLHQGDPDLAEDLMMTAVAKWMRYEPGEGPLLMQLRCVTKRLYIDWLRHQEVEAAALRSADGNGCGPDVPDGRLDLLRELIREIPKNQVEAVRLRFVEGRTEEEVAIQVGVNVRTVRRWTKAVRLRALRLEQREAKSAL